MDDLLKEFQKGAVKQPGTRNTNDMADNDRGNLVITVQDICGRCMCPYIAYLVDVLVSKAFFIFILMPSALYLR